MVQRAEGKIRIYQAKLRHFEDLGVISASTGTAIGSRQKGASRVELAAVGMVDSARALQAEIDKYSAIVKDAEEVIASLQSETFQKILTLHYLCDMSLRSISDELKYKDPNSVYRAHGWALAEAQKVINEREIKVQT